MDPPFTSELQQNCNSDCENSWIFERTKGAIITEKKNCVLLARNPMNQPISH